MVRLVNDLRFRSLVVAIILGSAIAAAYEGPYVKAEFGREYEARTPPQEWRSLAPPRALTPPAAQMGP